MHLLLLSELVFALRANDPETFKRWLAGGIQDLGKPAIEVADDRVVKPTVDAG